MRAIVFATLLVPLAGCTSGPEKAPFAGLLEDLSAGRVERLHVCSAGGLERLRYLRRDPAGAEAKMLEVAAPGTRDAVELARAKGVPVHVGGEACE